MLGLITPESIQEVKDTARIEEVVRDFVDLKRRGQNLIGLCPFHSEKTPSFNVNPARNIYKCFGCGESGDPVGFLMEHEQLSFPEAIRWLARKYNLKLKETAADPEVLAEQQAKESLFLINQFARDFYAQQLFQTDRGKGVGLSYFRERGFEERIIRAFDLGYAPPAQDALQRAATQAGYRREQLVALGLVNTHGRDFFRDRVIFTIHNASGKVAAFAGRILQKKAKAPKYINSPETDIYHKSDVLYGLYQARQAIRRHDQCYLVEGYTDVLRLHQVGIEQVVASSGTSLTKGQIQLIKRHTHNVYMLFDGDAAGTKAALRGLDLLLQEDLNVRIVLLPDGEDPDSYAQSVGGTAFQEYIDRTAKDFILFKSDLLLAEAANDPIRKAALITDITESIAQIPDALKRALYVKECAQRFEVDEALLLAKLNQLLAKQLRTHQQKKEATAKPAAPPPKTEPTTPAEAPAPSGFAFQERDLVRILVRFGHEPYQASEESFSIADYIIGNIEEVLHTVTVPLYRRVLELALHQLDDQPKILQPDFWLQHSDGEIQQLAIDLFSSPYVFSENWERHNVVLNQKAPEHNFVKDAEQAVARYLQRVVKQQLELIGAEIKRLSAGGDHEALLVQLQLQQRYLKIKKELSDRTGTVIF